MAEILGVTDEKAAEILSIRVSKKCGSTRNPHFGPKCMMTFEELRNSRRIIVVSYAGGFYTETLNPYALLVDDSGRWALHNSFGNRHRRLEDLGILPNITDYSWGEGFMVGEDNTQGRIAIAEALHAKGDPAVSAFALRLLQSCEGELDTNLFFNKRGKADIKLV